VRRALNDNPVAQIAVLGVLAVVVAFLLMTRVMHKSSDSSSTSTTPSATSTAVTPGATTPDATAAAPTAAAPSSPGTVAPAPAAPPPSAGAVSGLSSKLVAGPGLPKPVARAYADDKAIVLLVFSDRGIDDAAVRASVDRLRGRSDLAVFVTRAGHIARYARITEGVDVNRVPALIVIRPRHLTHGAPTASVSYGFRGVDSVDQAVRDGLYKGPTNLPYYPR
jgi:hypothetical protein